MNLQKTLEALGIGADAYWKHGQSGKWVVYHWACEAAAAEAGIEFDPPTIICADPANKIATICVTGHLGDRSEWSIGEAAPYNTTQSYPFAMAEKRSKDRVILKLLGLHGLAYSEEEADDFKMQKNRSVRDPDWVEGPAKNRAELREQLQNLMHDVKHCSDLDDLKGMIHGPDADHADIIKQVKANWPEGWDSAEDPPGLRQVIETSRDRLRSGITH